jgi:hypothetical protein
LGRHIEQHNVFAPGVNEVPLRIVVLHERVKPLGLAAVLTVEILKDFQHMGDIKCARVRVWQGGTVIDVVFDWNFDAMAYAVEPETELR